MQPLPLDLLRAQQAIHNPEVQALMMKLAEFNLGVCMPHRHTESESFAALPSDLVQVEQAGQVSFQSREHAALLPSVPVSWRWAADGDGGRIEVTATCVPQFSGEHFFWPNGPGRPPGPIPRG